MNDFHCILNALPLAGAMLLAACGGGGAVVRLARSDEPVDFSTETRYW